MCSRRRDVIGPAELALRPADQGYKGQSLTPHRPLPFALAILSPPVFAFWADCQAVSPALRLQFTLRGSPRASCCTWHDVFHLHHGPVINISLRIIQSEADGPTSIRWEIIRRCSSFCLRLPNSATLMQILSQLSMDYPIVPVVAS